MSITDDDHTKIRNNRNSIIECTVTEPLPIGFLNNGYLKWATNKSSNSLATVIRNSQNFCSFAFNQEYSRHSSFLPLPDDAIEGTYLVSDVLPYINFYNSEYQPMFLQLYIQKTTEIPKVYLKRLDLSTANIVIADSVPSSTVPDD